MKIIIIIIIIPTRDGNQIRVPLLERARTRQHAPPPRPVHRLSELVIQSHSASLSLSLSLTHTHTWRARRAGVATVALRPDRSCRPATIRHGAVTAPKSHGQRAGAPRRRLPWVTARAPSHGDHVPSDISHVPRSHRPASYSRRRRVIPCGIGGVTGREDVIPRRSGQSRRGRDVSPATQGPEILRGRGMRQVEGGVTDHVS
jgi:hypothetical protein